MEGKLKALGGVPKAAVLPPLLQEVGKLAASVASVNTSASGSATGNSRNKCSLKPGHSLMDWIRLGSSGKDLTHIGPMAGKLNVTAKELAKHRSENDAWISIRGKVYNVTDYLSFHPGGIDQIMQGCGRDATDLFDNIHPWVNYEKILMKCYIGLLTNNVIDEVIVGSQATTSAQPPRKTLEEVAAVLHGIADISGQKMSEEEYTPRPMIEPVRKETLIVNFDWIQKVDTLFLYFYTGSGSNPYVEILPTVGKKLTVKILCRKNAFTYQIDFLHQIVWPVKFKINYETGKLEVTVAKEKKAVWTTFGTIGTTVNEQIATVLPTNDGIVSYAKRINYNCMFYEVSRRNGALSNVPLGQHVKIFNYDEVSRSYSPIPCGLREIFAPEKYTSSRNCFLVKRYPNGLLSTYITNKKVGDDIIVSNPIGAFDLKSVMAPVHFLMLAAGTGINPLLGLVLALAERRIKPVKSIDLLSFNRNEEDLLFRDELTLFSTKEPRFHPEFILSQGSAYWAGLRGHVSEELIRNTMTKSMLTDKNSLYVLACGSTAFGENVRKILQHMQFNMSNIYIFPG